MVDLPVLLRAAVAGVAGVDRPGQAAMAEAVEDAVRTGRHLLVQAGTGTGKSLAYLVPGLAHAVDQGETVVVATATLALQAQLVERDLPRLAEVLTPHLGRPPTFTVLKGRRNYVCRNKLAGGFPADDDDALLTLSAVDASASRLGAEVVRLRRWAESTESGDRDEVVPGVSERAWRQVSVAARECLGATCPMVTECFVERARDTAADVDLVVTNHALLAIDAVEGRPLLPEHGLLLVDEAHDLVDRVTSAVTAELSGASVTVAARKATGCEAAGELAEAGAQLQATVENTTLGGLEPLSESLVVVLTRVRDSARQVLSELRGAGSFRGGEAAAGVGNGPSGGARAVVRAAVEEVFETAERVLARRDLDVCWVATDARRGAQLKVAPMSVAMVLRDRLFADRTVVLTSATLVVGGSFDAVAGSVGLSGEGAPPWRGLDVGSPFDYATQAIVYVARHLPPPGRDGIGTAALDELEQLVVAAGGRTLGLFSSMRAAQAATAAMRERWGSDIPVLCQGEDRTARLVQEFSRSAASCLFGTLSLWQGVDVPGPACQLVVIDRLPFPRPDDPLCLARSRAVAQAGGNGFMAVSATHAALRLAQGTGRLIRSPQDRGVVAILDPRLVTARYSGFLQASLPPFWPTTDRDVVLAALRRLDQAPEPPAGPTALQRTEESRLDTGRHPGAATRATPSADSTRTAVTLGRPWTSAEDAQLRRDWLAGLSAQEVAEKLGAEPAAVVARAELLSLSRDTSDTGDRCEDQGVARGTLGA